MQLSIKLVVGLLLAVASTVTMIACQVPSVVYLQRDATRLVEQAAHVTTLRTSTFIKQRLQRMMSACNVAHRAASRQDILSVDALLHWVGRVVEREDFGAGIFDDTARGIYLDAQPTALTPKLPGCVYVANLTEPGQYFDMGQFRLSTHAPMNTTHPWTRVLTTVSWAVFPELGQWKNDVSRGAPIGEVVKVMPQWARLAPFNPYSGVEAHTESALFYGGPTVGGPHQRQYVVFMLRGSWFSRYFATVSMPANGAALLVDAVSGAFIAGNINDPTGKSSGIELMPVSELRDRRIASILAAPGGLHHILTCSMPCSFTYWPHKHEMRVPEEGSGFLSGPLFYSRVVVHVVPVLSAARSGTVDSNLDLRLIVTMASDDVVGTFIQSVKWNVTISAAIIAALSILVIVGVALSLRGLTEAEKEMQRMASIFESFPVSRVTSSFQSRSAQMVSAFSELHKIFLAVRALSWQLRTLRAFSTRTPSMAALGGCAPALRGVPDIVVPYSTATNQVGLWQVPVTTVVLHLRRPSQSTAGPYRDLTQIHDQCNAIHAIAYQGVSRVPGASMDGCFGDHIMVHFNARGRTPHHAVAAVMFVQKCRTAIRRRSRRSLRGGKGTIAWPSVHFGTASTVAHCGWMGSASLRSFTVVSAGAAQASFLSRAATAYSIATLVTWRAVDVARQQLESFNCTDGAQHDVKAPLDTVHVFVAVHDTIMLEFVPAVLIILPGDAQKQVSHAYTPVLLL
jgi:hypothetical protein